MTKAVIFFSKKAQVRLLKFPEQNLNFSKRRVVKNMLWLS